MSGAWLSRAQLRTDAGLEALGPVLVPGEAGPQASVAHRMVWTLFADDPDRKRDFLWRQEAPGRFLTLSARRPREDSPLFAVESKAFAPALRPGDRLGFALRANPTVQAHGPDDRSWRSDVVMHALQMVSSPDRAARRPTVIRDAGAAWLARQGERHGFAPDQERLAVDGYEQHKLPRADQYEKPRQHEKRQRPIRFSTLDFEGLLTVTEPEAFVAKLLQGFGRARAFGYGLMLIRRA